MNARFKAAEGLDSNARGRGIAQSAGQPVAARVPRLRGTQAVHSTVLMLSFMKLFRLKAGLWQPRA